MKISPFAAIQYLWAQVIEQEQSRTLSPAASPLIIQIIDNTYSANEQFLGFTQTAI
ncbi:MAG: hypothetical protein U0401_12895 [Anaerolineae bacterium]